MDIEKSKGQDDADKKQQNDPGRKLDGKKTCPVDSRYMHFLRDIKGRCSC